jgi:hypothetical protein
MARQVTAVHRFRTPTHLDSGKRDQKIFDLFPESVIDEAIDVFSVCESIVGAPGDHTHETHGECCKNFWTTRVLLKQLHKAADHRISVSNLTKEDLLDQLSSIRNLAGTVRNIAHFFD